VNLGASLAVANEASVRNTNIETGDLLGAMVMGWVNQM